MKYAEYYHRAYEDPAFRRKKLGDLRYFKNVNLGLFVFSIALGGVMTIYPGLTGGGWMRGLEMSLPLIILTGCMHDLFRSRLAALEAIEARDVAVSTGAASTGAGLPAR